MLITVGTIERLAFTYGYGDHIDAGQNPDRSLDVNWKIKFDAPLGDAIYERQGRRKWVCIDCGRGFA